MSLCVEIPELVSEVLRPLGALAFEEASQAYAVGGCVRDWCLGIQESTDIDITTEGEGIVLARRCKSRFGGNLIEHTQFGTATLTPEDSGAIQLDFASCRKEAYAKPAAYPKVSPGTLEEDLKRRDFTLNAMAVHLSPERFGELVDPFGGIKDLEAGRLKVLHEQSFTDDPSRILRGIRFLTRFGFEWEEETRKQLIRALAAGALGWLNSGRLQKEFDAMDREPDPAACFRLLNELLESTD